jgi:transposase
MRCIGVDAHKNYAFVAELLEDDTMKEYRVELDEAGLKELQSRLGSDAYAVMEASTSTFRLYDQLAPFAAEVTVAHPSQTRGATAFHVKTDRGDAIGLARLRKAGFIRGVWVPGHEIRALRNLTELRHRMSQLRQAVAARIKSLLAQEMMRPPLATLTGPRGRAYLEELHLGGALDVYMKSQRALHEALEKEVKRVDRHLATWCARSEDGKLLLTIPGVGAVVAASLLAQIGDITRFRKPRQLAAYAGIVPRVHQSGATLRTGRISRNGRPLMRWALGVAVPHVTRREGALKDFYQRLCERRPKGIVHVACAHKLLTVIWCMLKRRVAYDAQDEVLTARKRKALAAMCEVPQ